MQAKGFTTIELMMSLAIIGVIGSVGLPYYRNAQVKNNLALAVSTTVQNARQAQLYSQSMVGDNAWGIKIQNGSITVFQGVSYAARNTVLDQTTSLPHKISFSGLSEIVFSKYTGLPAAAGTITISATTNDTQTITLNSQGMLSY